jgi:phasin family protein
MRDVQFKALDAAQANAEATFEFARKLLTVTSVSDALQLQSSFARERFEALVDYSKNVQSTLTKVGTEATKPAKVMFDRAMSQSKTN